MSGSSLKSPASVIPAHPLALDANRRLDERRQRFNPLLPGRGSRRDCDRRSHHTDSPFMTRKSGCSGLVLALAREVAQAGNVVTIAGVCGARRTGGGRRGRTGAVAGLRCRAAPAWQRSRQRVKQSYSTTAAPSVPSFLLWAFIFSLRWVGGVLPVFILAGIRGRFRK